MNDELQFKPLQTQIRLQGFTYLKRTELLSRLGKAVDGAGGWILKRGTASAEVVEVHVELQTATLPSIYGALLGSGLHLTRGSHHALAERCNCSLHLPPQSGLSSFLLICAQIHFLIDPPPHPALSRLLDLERATD